MKNWEEDEMFSKKAPTAEDLQQIEEQELDVILEEANTLFDKDTANNTESVIESKVELTKQELEAIDEMVRIVEDPNYISPVRAKRLGDMEDVDSGLEEISFDEMEGMSSELIDYENEYLNLYDWSFLTFLIILLFKKRADALFFYLILFNTKLSIA